MNKILTLLLVFGLSFFMYGQNTQRKNPLPLAKFNDNVKLPLTATERSQIIEVYGEFADKYVFNQPHRLKAIKQILRNRIIIKQITNKNDIKPCPNLSEISLFNTYVSDLERDVSFNPKEFNPLKYNLDFYSRGAAMYHVDGTNYYIILKSQYQ